MTDPDRGYWDEYFEAETQSAFADKALLFVACLLLAVTTVGLAAWWLS